MSVRVEGSQNPGIAELKTDGSLEQVVAPAVSGFS